MLSVRLSEEMEERVSYFSRLENRSKSEIVKEALRLYFHKRDEEDRMNAYEMGKEFFGRYGSGEGDRSVTYKRRLKEKLREKRRAD
jgi:predicted DNA-binding protein